MENYKGTFTALFYLLMSILLERRLEILVNILNVKDVFRIVAESEGAGM